MANSVKKLQDLNLKSCNTRYMWLTDDILADVREIYHTEGEQHFVSMDGLYRHLLKLGIQAKKEGKRIN